MAHVFDQWTRENPETHRRVRTERWGRGKRWLARWDVDGVRDSLAFATRDEAEDHLAKIRTGAIRASHPRGVPTVREWVKTWRTSRAHHRESSETANEGRAARVTESLGEIRVDALTRADIQAAVVEWSQSLEPRTVHATYSVLTGAMKLAVMDGLRDSSPCVGVKLPRVERAKVVPLTTDQVATIASRMPGHMGAMVWVGAAGGLRGGELCGLSPDRVKGTVVTVDRQMVSLNGKPRFGPVKSEASNRVVDIGATAGEILAAHMKRFPVSSMGTIFARESGEPYTTKHLPNYWRPAIAGMALKPRSGFHDLRHYHASLLIAAGLSVRAVADRLGHADVSETLETYSHLWPSDEARVVAAIEENLRPVCDLTASSNPI